MFKHQLIMQDKKNDQVKLLFFICVFSEQWYSVISYEGCQTTVQSIQIYFTRQKDFEKTFKAQIIINI